MLRKIKFENYFIIKIISNIAFEYNSSRVDEVLPLCYENMPHLLDFTINLMNFFML